MQTEDTVDVNKRYLVLEGRASPQVERQIRTGLPHNRPSPSRVCFVSFAYADLPLPKEFDTLFWGDRLESVIFTRSRIVGVTQQFAKPFDSIPHGWKTICLIHFPEGVPEIIDDLPVVQGWYQSNRQAWMCNHNTWVSMLEKQSHTRAPNESGSLILGTDHVIELRSSVRVNHVVRVYADTLEGARLDGLDLHRIGLSGANLRRASIREADARNIELDGADLTDANLSDCDFMNAIFDGARLVCANLRNSNLTGASFVKADLSYADLRGADVVVADFTDAQLTGARLEGAEYGEESTKWPSGFDPKKHGAVPLEGF